MSTPFMSDVESVCSADVASTVDPFCQAIISNARHDDGTMTRLGFVVSGQTIVRGEVAPVYA